MYYNKKIFSRELRKNSTCEQKLVWEKLKNRQYKNLKFRRQHVLQGFVVDFYCHELKLILEIDGKIHEKQKEYDYLRQILIEEKGIRFIRVTNEETNTDINVLFHRIKEAIMDSSSKNQPAP